MKVLHILPSSYCGGSELCAYETVKVLNAAGDMNYTILPEQGDMNTLLAGHIAGSSIIQHSWWIAGGKWNPVFKLKMVRGYFKSAFRIRTYIKKNAIDVVITHTLAIPSGAIAARLANVPHVWYIHEYGDIDHGFNFVFGKKNTLRLINKLSEAVVFNSKTLLEHFKTFFTSDKLHVLNSVIEYPLKKPQTHKKEKSLSVCVVGRLSAGKNQQVIIDALGILKAKNINPVLTFVGGSNTDYIDQLHKSIEQYGLKEQVYFIGHTETPWEYVQKSDVVVVSSKMEAFGRVTIEGMKSGKVVVASNTGAGKELIQQGINGYLFDPASAQELAIILEQLWEMETIGFITEKAHVFAASNFNEDVHKEQILTILSSI